MKSKKKKTSVTRRDFAKSALAASSFLIVPRSFLGGAEQPPPSEQFVVAGIGAGGNMCRHDLRRLIEYGARVVALADPWEPPEWAGPAKEWRQKYYPDAKIYRDYRELLDKEKSVDGLAIATTDNWHAKVSMDGMRAGKSVYTEKPLTRTVSESRALARAASKYGVATQMGNNGHAGEWIRLICEHIWDGTIGPVREVHAWSDRAGTYWPQGVGRPGETPDVPKQLDWDLWLGPAEQRPYHPIYTRQKWRGWCDFGAGALGDMGCHILDPVYWALKLGHPKTIESTTTVHPPYVRRETFPTAALITYQFPSRGDMPPLTIKWYDGGLQPPVPKGFPAGRKLPTNGTIFVGDRGVMLNEVFQMPEFLPESLGKDNPTPKKVLPRSVGHHTEWIRAGQGKKVTCGANFDYSAGLTEFVLLGTIASRVAERLEWDGENMRITNHEEADAMLHHKYREGWEL